MCFLYPDPMILTTLVELSPPHLALMARAGRSTYDFPEAVAPT